MTKNSERTKMIIVTKDQFFNFIKSQPNDRKLKFSESTISAPCGCPMVHYAKEFFKEYGPVCALTSCWVKDGYVAFARFEPEITLYSFHYNATNYGQLKEYLSQDYPSFNWS